jgi:hypothetical protein
MKKFLLIALAAFVFIVLGLLIISNSYISSVRSFEELSIQGEGYQLHGFISEGEDPVGKWIVLVHGNRASGQDHKLYQTLRETLPSSYSILAVDLRGFGGSVGDGENQLPASIDRSEDLSTISDYLIENYGINQDHIILIGHSFGAAQVFSAAQSQDYLLVIPIGLGNWDALRESDSGIEGYIKKFEANSGIYVEQSVLFDNAGSFTIESLFSECPQSTTWLVYASQDDAVPVHYEAAKSLIDACSGKVSWSEVPFSDHMYGTEMTRIPAPLRDIYSRISMSLLKFRLVQILHSVDLSA